MEAISTERAEETLEHWQRENAVVAVVALVAARRQMGF
jgi:hypothetical protein